MNETRGKQEVRSSVRNVPKALSRRGWILVRAFTPNRKGDSWDFRTFAPKLSDDGRAVVKSCGEWMLLDGEVTRYYEKDGTPTRDQHGEPLRAQICWKVSRPAVGVKKAKKVRS